MGVLRANVESPAACVFNFGHHLFVRCHVARELIGDNHARTVAQALQQLSEEALRGFGVAPLLHEDIERISVLIDRAPQIHEFAIDLAEDLVEVPRVSEAASASPQSYAYSAPNLSVHKRIAPCDTSMPRSSIISCTSRKLRQNRK